MHNKPVVLQTVADFQHGLVCKQRLQRRQGLFQGNLAFRTTSAQQVGGTCAMRYRYIGGAAGSDREREADRFGLHRVERGGLGTERDDARLAGLCYPFLKRGQIADAVVALLRSIFADAARLCPSGCAIADGVCSFLAAAPAETPEARRTTALPDPRQPRIRGAPAPTSGPCTSVVSTATTAGAISATSVPVASATRRVSVENSIVFRKAISFGPSGG